MKSILIFLYVSICFNLCHSQQTIYDNNIYYGTLATLLVYHTPSAKAEAMGRGFVANNEGDYGSYYNPALTSLSSGLKVNYSYTEVGSAVPNLYYYDVSFTNKKMGSFGLSAYHYSKDQAGIYLFKEKYDGGFYDAIYRINYSREIFKDFYTGINLGVFHYSNYFYSFTDFDTPVIDDGVTLDLGLLKRINIKNSSDQQVIQFGAALYNITNSKIADAFEYYKETYKKPLPVVFRIGASYQVKFLSTSSTKNNLFSLFTHLEYEKIINSRRDLTWKLGEEFSIRDIFHLRIGYYNSKILNEEGKTDQQSQFSAGIGLSIPFHEILNLKNPLILKFDFSTVPPPVKTRYTYYNWTSGDLFTNENNVTLGLSINYIP